MLGLVDFDHRGDAVVQRIDGIVDAIELGGAQTGGHNTGNRLTGVKAQFTEASAVAGFNTGGKCADGG